MCIRDRSHSVSHTNASPTYACSDSFRRTQIYSDSLIPIQIHSVSPRSSQSLSDLLWLTQILAISHIFDQLLAVSLRCPQIRKISLTLILIHLISFKYVQIHADALESIQIDIASLKILSASPRLIQIYWDLSRSAHIRSNWPNLNGKAVSYTHLTLPTNREV